MVKIPEPIEKDLRKGVGLLREFKKFAMRGNVLDLAIGVIIGGAFGKIVTSIVNDIFMQPLSPLLGKVDFKNLFITLNGKFYPGLQAAKDAGAPIMLLGNFLQNVVEFLIIALVVFLVVRQINRLTLMAAPAPAGPTTKECPQCLSTIPIKATRCAHCTQPVT
ncbi:MAG TPA: large conductance mechanosensitive channel protein MscL [Verrucomicrobiae bacterium]|jgi:large conductance mechanosensitive channel